MTDAWRDAIHAFFGETEPSDQTRTVRPFERFVSETVMPAFQDLKEELQRHGRAVSIRFSPHAPAMSVVFNGQEEIAFRVEARTFPDRELPYATVRMRERNGLKLSTVESMLRSGAPDYRLEDITRDELIRCFLQHYMSRARPR